jgi:hypothetical protein
MGGPEMKRKKFSEEQIIKVLKEHEAGTTIVDLAVVMGSPRTRSIGGRRSTAGSRSRRRSDGASSSRRTLA